MSDRLSSWKLTLPCTRAEGEVIRASDDLLAEFDPAPVLMVTEEVTDDPDQWRLDAYFAGRPDPAVVAAVIALVPSAAPTRVRAVRIEDQDWLTMSQAGLDPIHAGRFFVQTGTLAAPVPAGMKGFVIPAGRAFGTGHHETTTGCLTMLDRIRARGGRVENLIDLGTGTGLLAFAGMHLWPRAYATATDIDPVSIEVTAENAALNGVTLGCGQGRLGLTVANGADDAMVQRRASYDLVIANILAAPLIEMAADFVALAAPGAQIVLAGLLTTQADTVARAYRREGCRLAERIVLGDWTILRLKRRRR